MKRIIALFLCAAMLAALLPFSAFAEEEPAAEPAAQSEAAPEKAPEPEKEEPKAEPEPKKEEPEAEPEAAKEEPGAPAAEPEGDTPVTDADEPAVEPEGDVPAESADEPEAPEDEPETPAGEPEGGDPAANAEEPEEAEPADAAEAPAEEELPGEEGEADPFDGEALEALAADSSGTCGEQVSWTYEYGELRISGTGAIYDYNDPVDVPWYWLNRLYIYSVVIEDGVTRIGKNAFANCLTESISIPISLTSIGKSAFSGADDLKLVYYTSGTQEQWDSLISNTDTGNDPLKNAALKLKSPLSWTFRDGVLTISGNGAIDDYHTNSDIPWHDLDVLSVVIEEGVTRIGEKAFFTCPAESIRIPGSVTEIGSSAFQYALHLRLVYYAGTQLMWDALVGGGKIGAYNERLLSAELHCEKVAFSVSQSYLLLAVGEEKQLSFEIKPECVLKNRPWSSSDKTVATVDGGRVTGVGRGTAYITVSVTIDGKAYSAVCRVDVTDGALADKIESIQLMTAAATAEVYRKEDHPRITILPVLEQNREPGGLSGDSPENAGAAIESARFALDAMNDYFALEVIDDRTLEIVPTDDAIGAARSGSKELKGSYTSQIIVKAGEKEFTTAGKLKLTVKKGLPAVKAETLAFNSALPEQTLPFAFTGGRVTGIDPDEAAAAKAKKPVVPEYLSWDDGAAFVSLASGAPAGAKGSLYLKVSLEGWSEPVSVTVPVTLKAAAPKLSFTGKAATLLQGTPDTAVIGYKVTPAEFANEARFPVTVEKIEVQNGKTYEPLADPDELTCGTEDGVLTLKAAKASADGLAHSYRITLNVGTNEKTFTFTVKTLAASAVPKLSAKVTGGINTMVPLSPCTIDLALSGFHAGSGESYALLRVERYAGKTLVSEDAKDLFNVSPDGSAFTFTEKTPGSLEAGSSFKAVFGVDLNGSGSPDVTLTVPLKITFAKAAPKVTVSVKAAGKLDPARRGNAVALTATVANLYGYATELVYTKKEGKTAVAVPEADTPFESEGEGGAYTVRLKDSWKAETKEYSVAVRVAGTETASKAIALPVAVGKVTVKPDPASVILYKNDRFSTAAFTLPIADESVSAIERIEPDAASAPIYRLDDLGSGAYALGLRNNGSPATLKNGTVKLAVYVKGCDKPVATVPLKVTYK